MMTAEHTLRQAAEPFRPGRERSQVAPRAWSVVRCGVAASDSHGSVDRLDAGTRGMHDGGSRLRAANGTGTRAMAGGRQCGRHAQARGTDPMVGRLRRPGPRQADRHRLPEQLQPEDRGLVGAGGACPAGHRRGHLYPQLQQANGERELYVGQQERRQHEGRGPELREYNVGASVGWETRFLGQIPALDRGGRRQPAGLRRRLRQRARAARCTGRGYLRSRPPTPT